MTGTPCTDERLSAYGAGICDAVPPTSGANDALQEMAATARLVRPDLAIEVGPDNDRIIWRLDNESRIEMVMGPIRHDASGPIWRDAPDFYLHGPEASITTALRCVEPLLDHLQA